jgi:lysophospholipase L1-like esterase
MIYAIIGLICLMPVIFYIGYRYGFKKASQAFFEMLFKFGFDTKVKAFKSLNKHAKPDGIVFVGDSITQDFNVCEYFKGYHVYNRGIGGDTTEGLLKRLDVSIAALKPSQVFIQMGTNDLELLEATADEIYKRMCEVVTYIKTHVKHTEIYLISLYPVNPLMDKTTVGRRTNENIQRTNSLIKNIDGITFINIYDKLIKEAVLNPDYSLEGLHLNQEGYEVVSKVIKPYLKK